MIILASNFSTILISIGVFLTIILMLVAILILARKKLTPQGEAVININAENDITVSPGNTILGVLSNNDIFFHRHAVVVELVVCANVRLTMVVALYFQLKQVSLLARNKLATGALDVR